jgi:hypothetical protein
MIEIKREVIEAAYRLLGPGDAYEGLKLTGNEESAQKFHDDVVLVAEFVGEIISHTLEHSA